MRNLRLNSEALVTGVNSLEYLKSIKYNKAMIITGGKSMFTTGVIDKVEEYLEKDGGEVYIYSGVGKNPTVSEVKEGLDRMNSICPDLIVAVGGGSPIDAAKIITLLYEYPELDIENISGVKLPEERYKTKFIAIPSTSGTGTEVTHVSVITYPEKNLKIGLKAESLRPDVAILDGNIPMSLPQNIAAETGMDALTHAIESYINKDANDFTEVLAKGAIEGLIKWLPISCNDKSLESREKVHNYQSMAGMAFSNSGLGMVHGISHAFGGRYNLAHGLTNAIILPYAMRYNSKDKEVKEKFESLARTIGCKDIIVEIENLKEKLGIAKSISQIGIDEEIFKKDFDILLENSMMGSTVVNPIKITKEDMKEIINAVYYGNDIEE